MESRILVAALLVVSLQLCLASESNPGTAAPSAIEAGTTAPPSGTMAPPSGTTAQPANVTETPAAPSLVNLIHRGKWAIKRRLSDHRISYKCVVDDRPCLQIPALQAKFQFTPAASYGGEYYWVIHDGKYAFGINDRSASSTLIQKMPLATATSDQRFQWRIKQNGKYVRFINRASGVALDKDDDFDALYSMRDDSSLLCQEWEILPVSGY